MITVFITPILKSLVVPVIWLALIGVIYSWIPPFFALNCIFFPANEEATLKTKQPIRFQGLLKITNHIAGKWRATSITRQILQLLFPKLLLHQENIWIMTQPCHQTTWCSKSLRVLLHLINNIYLFHSDCLVLQPLVFVCVCVREHGLFQVFN